MSISKRIIGYCRVSTEEQSKFGHSLQFQENAIKQYLSNAGYEDKDYKILTDGGKSGSNLNRPAIKEILKEIENKNIDILIFHKLDRVSRSLIDFSNLVKLCTKHDVAIISINENFNFTNANGRGMANVIMSFAQMEHEQISERTNNGMIAKLMKGQYAYGGSIPYGIIKDEHHKIKYDKDKKIILERIFNLHCNCHNREDIKYIVNKEFNLDFKYKQIVRILDNTIYLGYIEKKGIKYQLIEPIIDPEKMIININATQLIRGSRNGYMTKNKYKYKGYVYFRFGNEEFPAYNCTNFKKSCKYILYYARNLEGKKVYINQKEIDIAVDNMNLNKEVDIERKLDDIFDMFVQDKITEDEFLSYRLKIIKSTNENITLKQIDKIIIHENKYIEVLLKK